MANPYEPPQSTEVARVPSVGGSPGACQTCGTVLSAANTLYSDRGDVSCQRCGSCSCSRVDDARGTSAPH